jgi:copper chaperone CopZ
MTMNKETVRLAVTGMTCGNCSAHVKKALSEVPGVTAVDVDLAGGSATVGVGAEGTDVDQLIEAVRDAGYEAEIAR